MKPLFQALALCAFVLPSSTALAERSGAPAVAPDNSPATELVSAKYTKVTLRCANPGSHQDVAKTPIVTNSSKWTLGKNTKVFWRTNHGETGSYRLTAPLKPGASVSVLGKPGNSYSCSAYTYRRKTKIKEIKKGGLLKRKLVSCSNPGSHQDVAKTPVLKNTTRSTIRKGKKIYWRTNQGETGKVVLTADLKPGAFVTGLGKAGNNYSCTAFTY